MLYSHVTLLMLRVVDVITKTSVQQSARMLVGEMPGDIQIGALFPMHRQIAGAEGCGAIWEQYGIQRAEVAMLTVQELNRELPFRLGISIRDSCWTERIAMEQTIAFLREGVTQCSCCQTAGCQKKANPVVAIVGPAKSSTTIAVQNLLQVFRIPQIGYAATTTDLSDKEQFGYYLRVVPSDAWQAMAINQLLMHFRWTYIAVVYSAGNYGEKGFEAMERLTHAPGIDVCIAYAQKVKSLGEPEEFENVLKTLNGLSPRPQVVVCFCEGLSMKKMFQAQKALRLGKTRISNNNTTTGWKDRTAPDTEARPAPMRAFQWIGSDGWADRYALRDMYNDKCPSSATIGRHNNNNNTLLDKSKRIWHPSFASSSSLSTSSLRRTPGNERMLPCPEMETINGTLLFRYMMNVTFEDEFQQEISFDDSGDPPAWYDILNYVGFEGFRLAGDFRQTAAGTHRLRMRQRQLMFYNKSSQMPESVCSKPCKPNQIQRQSTACCWMCENCSEQEIVRNNQCQKCPFGYWPAPNRSICVQLAAEYMEMTASVPPMVAIAFATLGIACTLTCILVFVLHNSTPVVKSTTRELSYIILGGIVVCFLCTFATLSKPSFLSCFVARTLPPIAFSTIYSALFTKTNRIARILAGSKKRILTKKPRFLSTFSQVVITWALVGIQCIIVAIGVLEEMPRAGVDPNFAPRRMVLICAWSQWAFLAPFMWNFILVLFCTLYAFKTRNLPENFNEAKFIGFTMYCTLVTWGAFVVLYVNAVNKALTASFTFSLSASIALCLLFFPKIFIILLRPEKNVRSSYTTTKLIRCHFGNAAQASAFSDSKQHISGTFSKTRNSSQSLSIGAGSCPTRTASLHVVNHSSATNQSNSTSNQSHQTIGNNSPRRDIQTQTEVSAIAFSHGGLATRFTRTFSVMGGGFAGGGGSGMVSGGTTGEKPHYQQQTGGGGVPTTMAADPMMKENRRGAWEEQRDQLQQQLMIREKRNRKKVLDEDVIHLIDTCRRYQDERLLINPSTIENMLLEEHATTPDDQEDRSGEKVTQLLAGTVCTLAQTVSRTAGGNNTPKVSSTSEDTTINGSPSSQVNVRHKKTSCCGLQQQPTAAQLLYAAGCAATAAEVHEVPPMKPLRSSIKSRAVDGGGGGGADRSMHRVDFVANLLRHGSNNGNGSNKAKMMAHGDGDKMENGGGGEGRPAVRTATVATTTAGEDNSFEQLLRSKGYSPVHLSRATQL